MQDLNASISRQPEPDRVFFGPYLSDKDEQAAKVHESEYQLRRHKIRQKSCELYLKRIVDLDAEKQRASSSADRPVSMKHNPLRHLPCQSTPEGGHFGEARHCACHRIHNLSELFVQFLNKGFLEQCVSATKYCRCAYHWSDICAAINFLLVPTKYEEAREENIRFYEGVMKLMLEVIELEKLVLQCEFDTEKGATPPVTAAATRWGTAFGAAAYIYLKCPLLAFAVIKRYGFGLEERKIRAAADALLPCGFESAKYNDIRLEAHVERHFAFFSNVSDNLQVAIAYVVNLVVLKPLMAAVSSDDECGLQAMGLESKIRCILMILRRGILVRLYPWRGWAGWNKRITMGFRTNGAEFNPDPNIVLLNPRCEDKVRRIFGDFPRMEKLVEAAATAIPKFLETVDTLARRSGPMLPEDSLEHWKKAHRNLPAPQDPGPSASKEEKQSFKTARVCQAHWLAIRVFQTCADMIDRPNRAMHREVYGVGGFIANMGKAVKTACLSLRMPNGSKVDSPVVTPDKFARPNAANALVQGRDLVAHYLRQGLTREELLKCLPTYCQTWSEDGLQQLQRFVWGQREQIPQVLDSQGNVDAAASAELKNPLSSYPDLDRCSMEASACLCNSKQVESSFSPLSTFTNWKGTVNLFQISSFYMKNNHDTSGLDARNILLDKPKYWAAHRIALLDGWKAYITARDEIKGDKMSDANIADKLPKFIRNGGSFPNPRHGGSSRTDRYTNGGVIMRGRGVGRGRRDGRGRVAGCGRNAGRGHGAERGDSARRGGRGWAAGCARKRARLGRASILKYLTVCRDAVATGRGSKRARPESDVESDAKVE